MKKKSKPFGLPKAQDAYLFRMAKKMQRFLARKPKMKLSQVRNPKIAAQVRVMHNAWMIRKFGVLEN